MDRRNLLTLAATGAALAACGGTGTLPTLPVKIDIPDELKDALAAIGKLDGIRSLLPGSISTLIDQGKDLVARIEGAVSLDTVKSAGGQLVELLGNLTGYLGSSSNGTIKTIVTAIETLLPFMGSAVGLHARMAARRPTGMSVAQARLILRR